MSRTTVGISPELNAYLAAHSTRPDQVQRDLIERTALLGDVAGMQIAPEQGAFLTLLTRVAGARRAVEVGTFTGYSSLCIARGLPADGYLLCCDVSEEWTALARQAWQRAGVAGRIELRIGPAADTLAALPRTEPFDLAFIDADKTGYPTYYAELLPRMRPGGVILVDNVFQSGRVLEPDPDNRNAVAIKEFNDRLAADDRVDVVMLPIADGLTMAVKK
jgi:caffeoyl-CoA O-methyltransferase